MLRRSAARRPRLTAWDRLVFVVLYRLCPQVLDEVAIVSPDTVICWHRGRFKAFWRCKSRSRGGRLAIPKEICDLIGEKSRTNSGAPRIHGGLLKLGIEVAQLPSPSTWSSAAGRHRNMEDVPAQPCGWNCRRGSVRRPHDRLQAALLSGHPGARPAEVRSSCGTAQPTAEWIARQTVEAFSWDTTPRNLVRDRDAAYGHVVNRQLPALGIRDRPTAPRPPWQNAYVERLIGSARDASASTRWSCSARHIFAASCPCMPVTTTRRERTRL